MHLHRYSWLFALAGVNGAATAAELPVPCIAGSCGAGIPGFVTSGQASAIQTPTSMTIEQLTANVTLNWQSFNIGPDGTVTFKQPDAGSIALNRIFQADASRILGQLNANGRVFLVNQNGIVFGEGARVNASGLVASSLDITPAAVERGIAQAVNASQPAFRAFTDASGAATGGAVTVERGATIDSPNGQVLLFAPAQVENRGTIRTPDGQTILAAGEQVFLAASTDPNLRGLLVEVGPGGRVTNGVAGSTAGTPPEQLVGQIIAERGNITLAGLAVNQHGRVSATTSVRANGSIRLLARDQAQVVASPGGFNELLAGRGGTLTLGEGSRTEVTLDLADTATAVDATAQPRSQLRLDGREVTVARGARLTAHGGSIDISARSNPAIDTSAFTSQSDGSRIRIAEGAVLDVSGADIALPMERNVLRVELRANQLRDSPAQRDGALRGQAVFVDVRQTGTREDGSRWVGTPLADLSGDVSTIARAVGERNLAGGTIRLQSQGDVVVARDATLDVSGGSVRYQDGYVNTSRLIAADGSTVDIARADPARAYRGVLDNASQTNRRWGVTENYDISGRPPQGAFEAGYLEGKDAGSVTLVAPQLVFDGNLSGHTVRGVHQRAPTATLIAGAMRPYDQIARGATLIVGSATPAVPDLPDNVVNAIRVEPGAVLGSGFDVLRDALPAGVDHVRLRPELLGGDGAQHLSLFANEGIHVPDNVVVDLGAGGSFAATAGTIRHDGVLRVGSGSVSLEARPGASVEPGEARLTLGSHARIEAQGRWVNDNPVLGDGRDPLYLSGGSVSLGARQGRLELLEGSVIDVSGGAQRRSNGRITAGRGGSVTIVNTPTVDGIAFTPVVAAELRGFSFGAAGSLGITVPSVCISATDCAAGQAGRLWLAPGWFAQQGFADFRVTSNVGGIEVAALTDVNVQQRSWLPGAHIANLASGPSASLAARDGTVPAHELRPTSLSLNSQVAVLDSPLTRDEFATAPQLTIGHGATLRTQPGGRLSLTANTGMRIDGTLEAPAGRIDLLLDAGLRIQEFLPTQAIALGAGARLYAAGLARTYLDDQGARRGDVLGGGSVTITARRGYVLAEPGAVVDVSGTRALLDLRRVNNGVVGLAPTPVASAGGRVSLTAAEGILWSGQWSASGGDSQVANGELVLALDASLRNDPGVLAPVFPLAPRRIELSATVAPIVIGAGGAVPDALNGRALLSADAITTGGFDRVSLSAADLYAVNAFQAFGEVSLNEVTLNLRQALNLDAALITGRGASHLAAPLVSLGHADVNSQLTPDRLAGGTATLDVQAGHIDLSGALTFDGFDRLRLASSGDLRLLGVQRPEARRFTGSLTTSADLTLVASQLSPGTLTDYAVRLRDRADGLVEIRATPGASPAPVLSVGGSLSFDAPRIVQGGVVRAPLGQISLAGESVTLTAGSLTSTSLAGQTALFGSTQAGLDWVYELPDRQSLVFTPGKDVLPAQRIDLDGTRVNLEAGATVDLSGGGDLLGYEFVPGVGGSRDVLSNLERPDQFAVLPGLGAAVGPYDPALFQGSSLKPGDTVYLSGVDGLPAGTYTLLPARYALLPGAFLVSPVEGYRDINVGERFSRLDGSTVVAGRRTFGTTGIGDARTSGFAVRPGQAILDEARYDLTSANRFFDERARAQQSLAPRLPMDAGQLVLSGIEQLAIDGQVKSAAATGGRGAQVDIAGDFLRIVAEGAASGSDPDALLIDAGDLSRLGAESVLLGGVRRQTDDGTDIEVRSREVRVENGTRLSAPQLTVAARERVTVDAGATLEAGGGLVPDGAGVLQVRGDGALLSLSTGAQPAFVRRDEAGLAGTLDLAAGATVRSPGSVLLDASLDTRSAANLQVSGGSLQFGARRITLANAGVNGGTDAGLVLDPAALSSLGLRELALTSRSTIDVAAGTTLAVNELRLDAAGLRRVGTPGDARLSAERFTVANHAGALAPGSAAVSGGVLQLSSGEFTLGQGRFDLLDFGTTSLEARTRWTGTGGGTLFAVGDLHIDTPLITHAGGADSAVQSTGSLRLVSTAAGSTPAAAGLGAALTLTGHDVWLDSRVALPSGRLEVISTQGDLRLGSSARVDLAGLARDFDGVTVGSPGGQLLLDSRAGDVSLDSGAILSVQGAAGAAGGSILATAVNGTARIDATLQGGAGSRFGLDARALPSLDPLNARLNDGGFDAARSFRQRGAGDLVLGDSGAGAVRAGTVELFADQGSVRISGLIDTRATAGGRVRIGARDDVQVSGSILARSGEGAGTAARVELGTQNGRVSLAPGSRVAAEGGSLHLRLPRARLLTLTDGDAVNDGLLLAGHVDARTITVEGFARYDAPAGGFLTSAHTAADASNPWFADAAGFMAQAAAMRAGLGRSGDLALSIVPGLEVHSDADLTLVEDWNLFPWRFDGAPGVLTLRAGGDLRFAASLSDGFAALSGGSAFLLPTVAGSSWSYRLVAGADANAANPLAVRPLNALGESSGSVIIEPGTPAASPTGVSDYRMVRTGTGSIEVAAGRDFVLGNAASVLYTAGTSGPGVPITARAGGLGGRTYPVDGGDIQISAGRDVIGASNDQLVTDWLWRSGRPASLANPSATAWTVNFGRFQQGVGALAGGRVTVTAGRDVRDLSANVAHIGRQVGGTTPAASRVEVIGGGWLEVTAGRDLIDGKYFVGTGGLALSAGGSIATDLSAPETSVGTVLALGDAQASLLARRDLTLGTIVNPSLLPQGRSQQLTPTSRSVFTTYTAGSAARLFAVGGDVNLLNDTGRLAQQNTSMTFEPGGDVALRIYPPSLSAVAFDGDLSLSGTLSLYPDAAGTFRMFANGHLTTRGSSAVEVLMSNADPLLMPRIDAPQADFGIVGSRLQSGISVSPDLNAALPLHRGSDERAHLVALHGDIAIQSGGAEDSSGFYFPMPARVYAGRDVRDLSLTVIHPDADDVTRIEAGRDVRYTVQRGERGGINRSLREIVVDGGGRLEIAAGRDVDLQTSAGITTRGDVVAPGVPGSGADIRVLAGLNGRQPDWLAFQNRYLRDGSAHDALLRAYVKQETGQEFSSHSAAFQAFAALSEDRRRPLLEEVFFAELRITGRIAAPLGDRGDFARAYAALETLFPGSNPDLAKGERNAYAGDIRLYFSRMYTLDGGDISLIAPGGGVNAGLAAPPVAFGVDKSPSQLGIVVQSQGNVAIAAFGDTLVNESRIFSADGGDILIWATRGDIDAGRGAKTAISAPVPTITFDTNGRPTIVFPAALTGSGIQTLATSPGRKPGNVDLFAPRGVVNASDAGIVAGNLTIAATAVLGANNIQVSGVSVGVPVDTGGLAAGLQGVSNVSSSSASAATATVERGADDAGKDAPLANAALGWLEVFVEGFGEEVCKADDPECLSRQRSK